MQTFLPYANIEKSMKVLDSRRLGKQRVEAFQILNILLKRTKSSAWKNHPAVKMWRGRANALKYYFNKSVEEWLNRGYNNTMKKETIKGKIVFPNWLGKRKFHSSHKSNLLRKNPDHYQKFNWREPNNLPYVWPKTL